MSIGIHGTEKIPGSDCCSIEESGSSQSGATLSLPTAAKAVSETPGNMALNGYHDSESGKSALPAKHKIIMGRYAMDVSPDGVAGEGSFCACRRAVVVESRQEVAIKVYRQNKQNVQVVKTKFARQIQVLQELAKPLKQEKLPSSALWGPALEVLDVRSAFVQLVDYSKSGSGMPDVDPHDGVWYCITELAEYSMKDYISELHDTGSKPSPQEVRSVVASALTSVAALHAKGFVHLDIKPENLMWSQGHWKLIDVDGCVPFGKEVTLEDETISFSAVYCAPEWAGFVMDSESGTMEVKPSLDAWSIGVTITELILLHPHYHSRFAAFMKKEQGDAREATISFLEWLSTISEPHLDAEMQQAEPSFLEMLTNMLLVPKKDKRSPVISCLEHQYIKSGIVSCHSRRSEVNVRRRVRPPVDENISEPPAHAGLVWKLNHEGDPLRSDHWLQRDMWLARDGSLCYFSKKENRGLVLLDAGRVMNSTVHRLDSDSVQPHAFQILSEVFEATTLAAESDEQLQSWMKKLKAVSSEGKRAAPTLHMKEMGQLRLKSRNRRAAAAADASEPTPQGSVLWKLNTDGNPRRPEDWLQRNMWLAADGSLCYHSKKEGKALVYFSGTDIRSCTVKALGPEEAILPNAFSMQLPPAGALEFEPALFAAKSLIERDNWLERLEKVKYKGNAQ